MENWRIKKVVTLEPITPDKLFDYVRLAWSKDTDLHLYHIEGRNTSDATQTARMARHTAATIMAESHITTLFMFKVMHHTEQGSRIIGFTVLRHRPSPHLFSFGINVQFRRPEILANWMRAINEELGDGYTVGLYNKNTRAIGFFERNSFKRKFSNKEYTILCHSTQD